VYQPSWGLAFRQGLISRLMHLKAVHQPMPSLSLGSGDPCRNDELFLP